MRATDPNKQHASAFNFILLMRLLTTGASRLRGEIKHKSALPLYNKLHIKNTTLYRLVLRLRSYANMT